ncbi:MAG: WD40 repeat domain-containing protein, partial [Bacteroidota bacterium]
MKEFLPLYSNKKKKNTVEDFFHKDGHLNDAGLILYVETKLLDRTEDLPKKFHEHIENCPACQLEILELYELMKDEPIDELQPHPILNSSPSRAIVRNLWKYTGSLSRVAAVILLTVVSCLGYLLVSSPNYSGSRIHSPFNNPAIDAPFHQWDIQSQQPNTLALKNGGYIHIPALAFNDAYGEPVQGKIRILYREFREASDIISSGIPMRSQAGPLETAGMFEIRAFKNDLPLQLQAGKEIEVNLLSHWNAPDFKDYYLQENLSEPLALGNSLLHQSAQATDASSPQWEVLGNSQVIPVHNFNNSHRAQLLEKQTLIDSLSQAIEEWQIDQKIQGATPKTQTRSLPSRHSRYFKLNFSQDGYSSQKEYQNQTWKFMGEQEENSPNVSHYWVLQETWDSLHLRPLKYRPLSLLGHTQKVNTAQFSPDDRFIVTASEDGTAKIWTNKAQYLYNLVGHRGGVNSAYFSPTDGSYILTASDDHTAKIWSHTGDYITTLSGHRGSVLNASYSLNGKFILTTSTDQTARLWNSQGLFLREFSHISSNCLAQFAPDSQHILVINSKQSAQVWSVNGELISTLPGKFNGASISPDSRQIVTTSGKVFSGSAVLWDINGEKLRDFDLNDMSAQITPDGQYLVSTTGNGSRLWYLNPAESYNTVLIRNMKNLPGKNRQGHEGNITSIDFSRDGNYILT